MHLNSEHTQSCSWQHSCSALKREAEQCEIRDACACRCTSTQEVEPPGTHHERTHTVSLKKEREVIGRGEIKGREEVLIGWQDMILVQILPTVDSCSRIINNFCMDKKNDFSTGN